MRKSILILIIVTVLAIIAVLVTMDILNINNGVNSTGSDASGTTGDVMKKAAIDFTLSDLEGNEVSLSDFKGKNVFLNFWATWCPPCKGEMPDMELIYQEYKDKDLVILAVNLGEAKDTVQDFINKNNYNFLVLLDPEGTAGNSYGVRAIPTSYFIDKEGYIIKKNTGAMSKDDMKSYIMALE